MIHDTYMMRENLDMRGCGGRNGCLRGARGVEKTETEEGREGQKCIEFGKKRKQNK